jgi:thiamine-monophosphate kinase
LLIKDIGERALINQLCSLLPLEREDVIIGPGDDAAAFKIKEEIVVFTTDVCVQDVHFHLHTDPHCLGWRVVAANVSDCIAMGASPLFATLALGLPPSLELEFIYRLYEGVKDASKTFSFSVVGGHTSSAQKIFVCCSMIGSTPSLIRRKGAKPGELIFVTGRLGEAAAHRLIQKERGDAASQSLFYPRPPIEKLSLLREYASSAIDVSDGFCKDLSSLLDASDVGAIVYKDYLPLSQKASSVGADPLKLALHGGEDYQIIFSAPSHAKEHLLKEGIHCVGKIMRKEEGRYFVNREGERLESFSDEGYKHF